MIKYILGAILILKGFIGESQTAALNFLHKDGETISGMKVMTLPTSIFAPNIPQQQVLIWYPPSYNTTKDSFRLIVFNPGDGENNSLDITQVTKNSLARMLAAGMKAYSLVGKDTIWYVVAITHTNAGSALRAPQAQSIPWLLYKSGLRVKPKVIVTGLSGGGSATYASIMTDSNLTKLVGIIVPLANWGWDENYKIAAYRERLDSALHQYGVSVWEYIGTQDPGFQSGFTSYRNDLFKYSLPGMYHEHIITNGKHDASVWDVPWNSRTTWDSLGIIIGKPTSVPAPPSNPNPPSNPPPTNPPASLPYPVRIVVKYSDSSCQIIYMKP